MPDVAGLPDDFDAETYLALNPDVAAAGIDGATHYAGWGRNEGRRYVAPKPRPLDSWNKVHLLGAVSAALNLRRYLEVTTTLTGGRYDEAVQLEWDACMRLVYRLDAHVPRDKLTIDFESPDDDIAAPLAEINRRGLTFDLILIDAHHTYECAIRDMRAALPLLAPGGVMLVHDCNPSSHDIAAPQWHDRLWCGVSYKAYLDVCVANPGFDYFTIDADFGCGVIMRPRRLAHAARNRVRARRQRDLARQWQAASVDDDTAYAFFDANRQQLLRLGGFDLLRYKLSRPGWF